MSLISYRDVPMEEKLHVFLDVSIDDVKRKCTILYTILIFVILNTKVKHTCACNVWLK